MHTSSSRPSVRRFQLGVALPVFLITMGLPSWAAAANLFASTTGSTTGDCHAAGLACSLTRALSESANGDTVLLEPGTYFESGLVITKAITLTGTGPLRSDTVIDGGLANRIFTSDPGPAAAVVIDFIKLRNGVAPSAQPSGGGAILVNTGRLEVRDAELFSNSGSSGGAISCYLGCEGLIVRRSLLEENTSQFGGAIYSMAPTQVLASQLNRNVASSIGGGIHAFSTALTVRQSELARNEASIGGGVAAQLGSTEILQSLLVRNVASSGGGGVYVDSVGAQALTVHNSTFFANKAGSGGAVLQNGNVQVTIVNATLSDNQATGAGNASDLEANGIAPFTLQGSILTHPSLGANRPQCAGPLALLLGGRNNLIDATTTSCNGPANDFQLGALTPAALDPLADYGGPTRTLRPPAGSNAIDLIAGNCTNPVLGAALIEDQRTFPRPVNDCDCGAVERE